MILPVISLNLETVVDDEMCEFYSSVDFKMKEMKVSDQSLIKLQVWDFAADIHSRFANVAKHSYSEAHAIIIVFDITNKESYQDLGMFCFEEE